MSPLPPDPADRPAGLPQPWEGSPSGQRAAVFEANLRPHDVPPTMQPAQRRATVGAFRAVWRWFVGHCPEWAHRAGEAKVLKAEAEADQAHAEALKTMAEARKLHAEAEAIRAATAREKMRAELAVGTQLLELQIRQAAFADYERWRRQPEAMERVADAISRVEQAGGSVQFDADDARLLGELPEDEGT